MKKKILSLLIAFLVVLCFVFTACENMTSDSEDGDTSSITNEDEWKQAIENTMNSLNYTATIYSTSVMTYLDHQSSINSGYVMKFDAQENFNMSVTSENTQGATLYVEVSGTDIIKYSLDDDKKWEKETAHFNTIAEARDEFATTFSFFGDSWELIGPLFENDNSTESLTLPKIYSLFAYNEALGVYECSLWRGVETGSDYFLRTKIDVSLEFKKGKIYKVTTVDHIISGDYSLITYSTATYSYDNAEIIIPEIVRNTAQEL